MRLMGSSPIAVPAAGIRRNTAGRRRLLVLGVALAAMLAPLNSTMIAVALPQLLGDLKISVAQAGWLVTSYLIAQAGLQPVAGRLGDLFGRRRVILLGLVYFCLVSAGAALAHDLDQLLLCRVQQAIAAALTLPNGIALIRESAGPEQRGKQLGLIGSAIGLAAAGGPVVGGALVSLGGWRAIFAANVLVALPALAIGYYAIPERAVPAARRSFDWVGALLLLLTLAGVAWSLTALRGAPPTGRLVLWLLLAALAVAFLRYEARRPDAVLPPGLFRRRGFAAANAAIATSNLAMYVTLLAVPLWLAGRPGWRAAQTGLVLAAMSGALMLVSPAGGWLADRWGRRWPTALGLALFAAGVLPLALQKGSLDLPVLLPGLACAGAGLGLAGAGMQAAALENAPAALAGVSAGVYSTSRYLGSIVGSTLLAMLLSGGPAGFAPVFTLVATVAAASVLAALALPDWPAG